MIPKLLSPGGIILCCIPTILIISVTVLAIVLSNRKRSSGPGLSAQYPPPPAPVRIPAGWQSDPTGRHEFRYWDGSGWTAAVSDTGQVTTDPL